MDCLQHLPIELPLVKGRLAIRALRVIRHDDTRNLLPLLLGFLLPHSKRSLEPFGQILALLFWLLHALSIVEATILSA